MRPEFLPYVSVNLWLRDKRKFVGGRVAIPFRPIRKLLSLCEQVNDASGSVAALFLISVASMARYSENPSTSLAL